MRSGGAIAGRSINFPIKRPKIGGPRGPNFVFLDASRLGQKSLLWGVWMRAKRFEGPLKINGAQFAQAAYKNFHEQSQLDNPQQYHKHTLIHVHWDLTLIQNHWSPHSRLKWQCKTMLLWVYCNIGWKAMNETRQHSQNIDSHEIKWQLVVSVVHWVIKRCYACNKSST